MVAWRSFRTAAWLGWQIESNWADPLLFAIYSVVKPLATAAILVVMYAIVTDGDFTSPVFVYIYLGNAFYVYVGAILTGMAFAVIDDRERYRTLKYVYVAPIDFRLYLAGRATARFLTGSMSVVVTMLVGMLALGLPIDPTAVRWPLFLLSFSIGIVMLAVLGLWLAAFVMQVAHQSWLVGEAVAGTLFLFSGAVFPLDVLPVWLRPVGYLLPITYWLELVRRSLVGSSGFATFAGMSDAQLLGWFVFLTAGLVTAALASFAWYEHSARERGLLDRTTNY